MSILTSLTPAGAMVTVYKYLAIAGVVIGLAVGAYFYGVHNGKLVSKVAIAEYESKVVQLQNKLDNAILPQETQIMTKYVTQVIHDKQTGVTNNETAKQIQDVPSTITADSVSKYLSNGWVRLHDAAAGNETLSGLTGTDGAASSFTAPQALGTVVSNYSTCYKIRDQLVALQEEVSAYNNDIARLNASNKKK